jgi:hypothetical protein
MNRSVVFTGCVISLRQLHTVPWSPDALPGPASRPADRLPEKTPHRPHPPARLQGRRQPHLESAAGRLPLGSAQQGRLHGWCTYPSGGALVSQTYFTFVPRRLEDSEPLTEQVGRIGYWRARQCTLRGRRSVGMVCQGHGPSRFRSCYRLLTSFTRCELSGATAARLIGCQNDGHHS